MSPELKTWLWFKSQEGVVFNDKDLSPEITKIIQRESFIQDLLKVVKNLRSFLDGLVHYYNEEDKAEYIFPIFSAAEVVENLSEIHS